MMLFLCFYKIHERGLIEVNEILIKIIEEIFFKRKFVTGVSRFVAEYGISKMNNLHQKQDGN